MKKLLLFIALQCYVLLSYANHIVGGELYYKYKGSSTSGHPVYTVTLRFFRNMAANVPSIDNEDVYIGIYQSNQLINSITLPFERVDTIKSTYFPTCVNTSLQTVYEVGYFSEDVELPSAASDYTLAWVRCCRTNLVDNMNLSDGGITLTATIPGAPLTAGKPNNSAIFPLKDTVLLCNGQWFQLDFGARDPDGDSLSYAFYTALDGGNIIDPAPSPFPSVIITPLSYKGPSFSAMAPMGPGVKLDPSTGIFSGIAPPAGTYLVTVRVYEWRKGQVINDHSKDILLRVKDCSYSLARLEPSYLVCKGSTVYLTNEAGSNPGDTWAWDFGVADMPGDTSNLAAPAFTYPAPGTYTVKLTVNKSKPCPATASTEVKIYPGINAAFSSQGNCVNATVSFVDSSKYQNGKINQWTWDFGDPQAADNISHQSNPLHVYYAPGTKTVNLIVNTDVGCADTIEKDIPVFAPPVLSLQQDTFSICRGDSVQLNANGSGMFRWSPSATISDAASKNPFAFPATSSTYIVTLTDANACASTATVHVTVLPHDAVSIRPVPGICEGDTIFLSAATTATNLLWTSTTPFSNAGDAGIWAIPPQNTWFFATANPGVCETRDSVAVTVLKSPQLNAGSDIQIQEGVVVQLNASGADRYRWLPDAYLSSDSVPNPFVKLPVGLDSITYVLSGMLDDGCIRKDSLKIHVAVLPFAGAPDAFTPNGDGLNDIFRPIVKGGFQLVDFAVYNRWGQLIFYSKRPADGWDGSFNHSPAAGGAYVWLLRIKSKTTGSVTAKKGTVLLVR